MQRYAPLKAALTVLVVAVAIAAAAVRLRTDADWMRTTLPASKEYSDFVKASDLFPDEDLILLALPSKNVFAASSIRRFRALSEALSHEAGGELWKVYSPFSIQVPELTDGILHSTSLMETEDIDSGIKRVTGSRLYSRLFLAQDSTAWKCYLAVDQGGNTEVFLNALGQVRSNFPELRVAGKPYYRAINERAMNRQFLPLLLCSALVLLFLEVAMVKSLPYSVLLWFLTLAPTAMLLGLMVLMGATLRFHMVLAPIVTLALSTSYTTHFFRGWEACGMDGRRTLSSRGAIIFLDAATTVFGYASLVVSPIKELREIGWYSMAGAIFSVVVALISLPAFLSFTSSAPSLPRRYTMSREALPLRLRRKKAAKVFVVLAWSVAMAASLLSFLRLEIGKSVYDQFVPGSSLQKEAAYFKTHGYNIEEVTLVVETGQEYGLVDPDLFKQLKELESTFETSSKAGLPYGYTDLVEEVVGLMRDSKDNRALPSREEIGEALELLSGIDGGLFSRGFVDGDWSAAKFRIPVGIDFRPIRDMQTLRMISAHWSQEEGGRVPLFFGGLVTEMELSEKAFVNGQLLGMFLFLLFLAVILTILFKSARKALAAIAVSAAGILASIGTMALLGWRYSDVNALGVATVAGTGVDSAIVMILYGYTDETRGAALDTSTLTMAALSVLLLCSSFLVVQTTIICLAGLIASTLTAQVILPLLLDLKPTMRSVT